VAFAQLLPGRLLWQGRGLPEAEREDPGAGEGEVWCVLPRQGQPGLRVQSDFLPGSATECVYLGDQAARGLLQGYSGRVSWVRKCWIGSSEGFFKKGSNFFVKNLKLFYFNINVCS
jgi:hypothetical protein